MARLPEEDKEIKPQIVEVEINTKLLNDKLNYIIELLTKDKA